MNNNSLPSNGNHYHAERHTQVRSEYQSDFIYQFGDEKDHRLSICSSLLDRSSLENTFHFSPPIKKIR